MAWTKCLATVARCDARYAVCMLVTETCLGWSASRAAGRLRAIHHSYSAASSKQTAQSKSSSLTHEGRTQNERQCLPNAAAPEEEVAGSVFSSLHDAALNSDAVRRLDLSNSAQLQCNNLLCDQVGGPCICRLSRVLENVCSIEALNLRGNALTELPPSLWSLSNLTHLDISDNRLSILPPAVGRLTRLQSLTVSGNSSDLQLPLTELASLPALRILVVDKPLRLSMARDPAAAPLLHWLHF